MLKQCNKKLQDDSYSSSHILLFCFIVVLKFQFMNELMNEFCFLIVYDILLFSFSVCSLDIILFIFAWNSMFKQLHTEI